jgi:hypothetical protein
VILIVIAFATPILLTDIQHLPYMTRLIDRISPYLVYPSILGTYQVRPLPYSLGNAPTIGRTSKPNPNPYPSPIHQTPN